MTTVGVYPQLGLWAVLLMAGTASAHGDLDEQIRTADKLLEKSPRDARLHFKRGELRRFRLEEHRETRDRELAEKDYDRTLELDPAYADRVDLERGKLWLLAKLYPRAEAALDRLLERQPDHPDGRIARARVRFQQGKLEGAVEDYDRAISKGPRPRPQYYLERAEALVQQGEEHVAEAIRGLDDGVRRLGPLVTLHFRAIELEVASGRYDSALGRLDALMPQFARKDSLLARRGDILKKAGRSEEARKAYAAALAAIERLPASRRRARTTRELEKKLRAELGVNR